jgi:hypothetical protein
MQVVVVVGKQLAVVAELVVRVAEEQVVTLLFLAQLILVAEVAQLANLELLLGLVVQVL